MNRRKRRKLTKTCSSLKGGIVEAMQGKVSNCRKFITLTEMAKLSLDLSARSKLRLARSG